MRKHFLLLMLMALLPLAGWAQDKVNLKTCTLQLNERTFEYTGSAVEVSAYIKDPGTLSGNISTSHYEIKYYVWNGSYYDAAPEGGCVVVGSYYVRAEAVDSSTMYEGQTSYQPFEIVAKNISTAAIGDFDAKTYNFSAQTYEDTDFADKVTLEGFEKALVKDVDYTVAYQYNENANNVVEGQEPTITFTGKGNFTGTATKVFTIKKLKFVDEEGNLADGLAWRNAASLNNLVYTGYALYPTLSINHDGINQLHTNITRKWENSTNATTESSKAKVILTGIGNFEGSYEREFEIAKRDLSTVSIASFDKETYQGADITPATTGKLTYVHTTSSASTTYTLLENTDYTAEYASNKVVGTASITFTAAADGNFKGTNSATFTIDAAPLSVKADDKEKYYGDADPATSYTVTGWVGEDITTNPEITGKPTITRTSGEDINSYAYNVDVTGMSVANYTITAAAEQGKLTIKKATVIFTVTDANETYGYQVPALNALSSFNYTVSGLKTNHDIASVTWAVKDAEGTEYVADDMLKVREGNYTISATAITTTGGDYDIIINNGTLTVSPYKLTIVAQPQAIAYPAGEAKLAKNTVKVDDEFTSWDNNLIKLFDADETLIGKTAFVAKYGVWKEDFVESLTWENEEGQTEKSLAHPGFIKVNLKAEYDNNNFTVTSVNGEVTWNGVETGIEIVRLDINEYEGATTVADKLKEYDGVPADVTLKAKTAESIEAFRVMKANRWYSLVLPFNTSVREISKAFGYAVVDVFSNSSTDTDVNFSLWLGAINANEPFLLKIDADRDLFVNPVTFSGVTIAYEEEPAAVNNLEDKFIGAYDGKKGFEGHEYVFSLGTGNISGTSATTYIPAMAAYIQMAKMMDGMNNARVINIEEPDGSMTSVNSIGIEGVASGEGWYNLNGVKLQGVPSTKGVYIQNGKKTIIK